MRKRQLTHQDIKETIRNGWELFKQQKLTLAFDQFEKLLNSRSHHITSAIYSEALCGIGLIFKEWKRFRDAKTCFKKAYQKTKNIFYLIEYGDACKSMKWYSEAIDAWKICLSNQKNDIRLLVRIAECYDLLGNFVLAKKYFNSALEINPTNKFVLIGLGYLYFHNHLYLDAIYYWEEYCKNNSYNDVEILTKLGVCYTKRQEFKKANEYFVKALSLQPNYSKAIYGIAQVCNAMNDTAKVKYYYERLSLLAGSDYKEVFLLLTVHEKLNKSHYYMLKKFEEKCKLKGSEEALFEIGKEFKKSGNLLVWKEIVYYLFYHININESLKNKVKKEMMECRPT